MIEADLIVYYNINEEKAAKLMTITKSNIYNISKSGSSNTIFLQFTSKARVSITEYHWMSKTIYKLKKSHQKHIFPFHLIYRSFESNVCREIKQICNESFCVIFWTHAYIDTM